MLGSNIRFVDAKTPEGSRTCPFNVALHAQTRRICKLHWLHNTHSPQRCFINVRLRQNVYTLGASRPSKACRGRRTNAAHTDSVPPEPSVSQGARELSQQPSQEVRALQKSLLFSNRHLGKLGSQVWAWLVDICPPLGAPQVLRKAAFSFLVVVIFRLGSFIPLYGIDRSSLPNFSPLGGWRKATQFRTQALADNIFMLDVAPAAMASIAVLLSELIAPLRIFIRSKPGQEGHATQTYGQRGVALFVALIMAYNLAQNLRPFAQGSSHFVLATTLNLAAGAAIVTHLTEEVRVHGLGDGLSLFIFVPMLLRQAETLRKVVLSVVHGMLPWKVVLPAYGAVFALMVAAVHVSLVEKFYEIMSFGFKPKIERRGRRKGNGLANRMPLRIAPSGASCLLTINLYGGLIRELFGAVFKRLPIRLPIKLHISPVFIPAGVALLAFLVTSVDLSFGREAEAMGEHMQEANIGLRAAPPLIPGEITARYLSYQMALVHFWGGIVVGAICGLAVALDMSCSHFLHVDIGATTMLLLTGYITTLNRQVSALSELPKLGRKLEIQRKALQQFRD